MKTLLMLFLALSLSAAGFWTLTGLQKANIYLKNELTSVKPQTITAIKAKMAKVLKANGIKTKQQDSPTLMIALEELSSDENYYIYIKLALGEETQTFRSDKSKTFALTYAGSDFIEVDAADLDEEILESVDYLLGEFSEQYSDDNE